MPAFNVAKTITEPLAVATDRSAELNTEPQAQLTEQEAVATWSFSQHST
jgi:hypothetical protein